MRTKLLKSLLTTACLLCSIGVYAYSAVVTPYSCDFTNGGEGFTCYDQDGEVPSVTAQKYGFSADAASWIFGIIEREYVAMSNSSHKKATATAEDWLITPAITLGEGNTLSFDAYTVAYSNTQKVATIDVKLSTTGIAIEDFTIDLLSDVQVTSGNYGVNLSAYAGQTVYIAIINKSRGKDMLFVDNLFVGVLPIATAKAQYTRLQENVSVGQRIAVELTAGFGDAVTSIDATLTCGDFTTRHAEENLTIEAGAAYIFQFDEVLPAPTAGEGQFFEVSVLVNGTETVTAQGEIITQAYQPAKRIVCEAQTGTWCGYSPRANTYMELMDEMYPDTYIGIVSHWNDIMQYYDYNRYLDINSSPSGRVQRDQATAQCDPSDFPTLYNDYINTPALADIAISAEWIDDTKSGILLTTNTTFALNARNLDTRLEYVIVEDDVNQPGNNNYDQSNYFAGGQYGQMGGYENKSNPVLAADMFYDDVVRYVITDYLGEGIIGSVPTKVEKGVTYKHHTDMTIPTNVHKVENCEFIVLLIDFESGMVLNAAKCKIGNSSSIETSTEICLNSDDVEVVMINDVMKQDEISLPISLINTNEIAGLQCDIFLPDGLTPVMQGDKYDVVLSSRAEGFDVTAKLRNDGALRVVVVSTDTTDSIRAISGNEGELFTIKLKPNEQYSTDDNIAIRNIVMTGSDYAEYEASDVIIPCTIKESFLGDVNRDGKVNVTDVIVTIGMVLSVYDGEFDTVAADIDQDGEITIVDAVGIINLVLDEGDTPLQARMQDEYAQGELTMQDVKMSQGETKDLVIGLTNEAPYTAFQMDVTLPAGLNIEHIALSERANGHTLQWQAQADGSVRIVGYALDNATIADNDGTLLTLTVSSDSQFESGEVVVSNTIFSTRQLVSHRMERMTAKVSNITALNDVVAATRIYATDRKVVVDSPVAQEAAISTIDGVVQRVALQPGRNEIPLQQGVYIVAVDAEVKKVVIR